jgi:hypothetical protein
VQRRWNVMLRQAYRVCNFLGFVPAGTCPSPQSGKRVTRNLLISLSLLVLSHTGAQAWPWSEKCDFPIHYKIGTVDSRFGIDANTFSATTEAAKLVWENAAGRVLFVFDPAADLKIALVYDGRQIGADERHDYQILLDQLNRNIEGLKHQYEIASGMYEQAIRLYRQREQTFSRDLASLNNAIDQWNAVGGWRPPSGTTPWPASVCVSARAVPRPTS